MTRSQGASQGHDLSWPELVPEATAAASSDTHNLPCAAPVSSCLAPLLIQLQTWMDCLLLRTLKPIKPGATIQTNWHATVKCQYHILENTHTDTASATIQRNWHAAVKCQYHILKNTHTDNASGTIQRNWHATAKCQNYILENTHTDTVSATIQRNWHATAKCQYHILENTLTDTATDTNTLMF